MSSDKKLESYNLKCFCARFISRRACIELFRKGKSVMSKKNLSLMLLMFFVVSTQIGAWPFGKKNFDPFSVDASKLLKVIDYDSRLADESKTPRLSDRQRLELVKQSIRARQEYAQDSGGYVLAENPLDDVRKISLLNGSPEELASGIWETRGRIAHNNAQLNPYPVKLGRKGPLSQDQIVDGHIKGLFLQAKTREDRTVIDSVTRLQEMDGSMGAALFERWRAAKSSESSSAGSDSYKSRDSDASVPVRLYLPRAARVGFAPVSALNSGHSDAEVVTHNPLAGAGGPGRGPSETVAAVRPSTRRSLRK